MSRLQDVINRLELVARKIGMSIEDAVLILEGKHPTHAVVQTHAKLDEPKPLYSSEEIAAAKETMPGQQNAAVSGTGNSAPAPAATLPPVIPGKEPSEDVQASSKEADSEEEKAPPGA